MMMRDGAHDITDLTLEEIEKRLTAIYNRAGREVEKTARDYFDRFAELDLKKKRLVESGKMNKDEYLTWRKNKILYGNRYKNLRDQIAKELLNVNRTATAYINGELPEIYALNYNAFNDITEGLRGFSLELTNPETVRNLAISDKTFLPYRTVDGVKDVRWNAKKINSEVLQGILQGDSMEKIAKRFREKITEMNKTSAIRNARTSVTSAENKGRFDSFTAAEEEGIVLKKRWISSNQPKRTREWHMPGAFENIIVDKDKPFVNGAGSIMYPGDPNARPENVYNCRCTMAAKVVGLRKGIKIKQKTIESNFGMWKTQLSSTELQVIGRYQSESFAFNQNLRGGKWSNKAFKQEFGTDLATDKEIKALQSALNKSKFPENRTVYRGIPDADFIKGYKKGDVIIDKGFASTSLSKDIAMQYGDNILLEIEVPKGSKAAYISNIKDKSGTSFAENKEVLLQKDSALKIKSITNENGVKIVKAEYDSDIKEAAEKITKKKLNELRNELIESSNLKLEDIAKMDLEELLENLKKYKRRG